MADMKTHIETLARKASESEKSDDAMRFSQAACNVANTLAVLDNIGRVEK